MAAVHGKGKDKVVPVLNEVPAVKIYPSLKYVPGHEDILREWRCSSAYP
jgi:hypothetical protein